MATITDLRKSNDPKKAKSARPWLLRYRDHTGKQRAESFTLKADAETRKTEVERAGQTGRLDVLDGGTQTLAAIGGEWFALHKGEFSANTSRQHVYIWNAVLLGQPKKGATGTGAASTKPTRVYKRATIVDLPVRSIRRSHVQAFKNEAVADKVPVTSIRLALSLISRVLDHAADENLIPANPARGVKPPAEPHRGDVHCASPEEVEAIRSHLSGRDAVMVSLMAYGGMRPQELRAIEKRHRLTTTLRLESALNDDGTVKRLKGTNGAGRSVPLCDALAADLDSVKGWRGGLLVLTDDGRPTTKTWWGNWRNRTFMPAVEKAGVPITRPYDLRHACASLWLREGIDPATVARRLGHSLLVLMRNYAHVIDDLDPNDRRTIDEMIGAARDATD